MMIRIEEFERVVTNRLQAVDAKRHAAVESLVEEMQRRDRLATEFAAVASRLHDTIILPRLTAVVRQLPNAKIASMTTPFGMRSECELPRSPRYPAHTKLSLSIARSPEATRGFITYSLEIIPILMAFHGECHLEFDPSAPNETEITEWVEARLLEFVDTYLRVGTEPQYQRSNLQIDPVCGMRISVAEVDEHVAVRGHTYHFCSARCREQFAAAPERYLDRPYRLEATT
jgi:YHS domain-containing protein